MQVKVVIVVLKKTEIQKKVSVEEETDGKREEICFLFSKEMLSLMTV